MSVHRPLDGLGHGDRAAVGVGHDPLDGCERAEHYWVGQYRSQPVGSTERGVSCR